MRIMSAKCLLLVRRQLGQPECLSDSVLTSTFNPCAQVCAHSVGITPMSRIGGLLTLTEDAQKERHHSFKSGV